MEAYERTVCFVETTDKDVISIKGIENIHFRQDEVIITKKNKSVHKFLRKNLVSIWFKKEICYDFSKENSKEGGEA